MSKVRNSLEIEYEFSNFKKIKEGILFGYFSSTKDDTNEIEVPFCLMISDNTFNGISGGRISTKDPVLDQFELNPEIEQFLTKGRSKLSTCLSGESESQNLETKKSLSPIL